MKAQISPIYLIYLGAIIIALGFLSLQNVINIDIPFISNYDTLALGLGFILVFGGLFGVIGIIVSIVIVALGIIGGVL
jgi:hypothetical protein